MEIKKQPHKIRYDSRRNEKQYHPERDLYYLGAKTIEAMNSSGKDEWDYFNLFSDLNRKQKISINLFSLVLDWLFILMPKCYSKNHSLLSTSKALPDYSMKTIQQKSSLSCVEQMQMRQHKLILINTISLFKQQVDNFFMLCRQVAQLHFIFVS